MFANLSLIEPGESRDRFSALQLRATARIRHRLGIRQILCKLLSLLYMTLGLFLRASGRPPKDCRVPEWGPRVAREVSRASHYQKKNRSAVDTRDQRGAARVQEPRGQHPRFDDWRAARARDPGGDCVDCDAVMPAGRDRHPSAPPANERVPAPGYQPMGLPLFCWSSHVLRGAK